MKKFLASDLGKRVLIGIGMVALAVVLWFATERIFGTETPRTRGIQLVASLGTGVSGLLFMMISWRGLLWGYGFILFQVLVFTLPDPWGNYFVFVLLLILFARPTIEKYQKKRKKQRAKVDVEAERQRTHEQQVTELVKEEKTEEFYILVQRTTNKAFYEGMQKDGELFFFKLGPNWNEANQKRIEAGEEPVLKRGDFSIRVEDITKLRIHQEEQEENPLDTFFTIYVQNKRYYLTANFASSGARLEHYLREHVPQRVQQESEQKPRFTPSPKLKRRQILNRVYLAICGFALLVGLAWLFLDVPYKLFAGLSLLPFPAVMTLYCLFPNEITITESEKTAQGRLVVTNTLFLFSVPLIIRFLIDFNVLAWGRYWLVVGVLLLGLLVPIYFCSEECRKHKLLLLGVAFVVLVYLFGATGQVNYLLDRGQPQQAHAIVQSMHISTSRSSPDRYYLKVQTGDLKQIDLQVVESLYDETQIGDRVRILIYPGALEIAYAEVEGEASTGASDSAG